MNLSPGHLGPASCHIDLILYNVLLDPLATPSPQPQIYIHGPDLLLPLQNCSALIRTCSNVTHNLDVKYLCYSTLTSSIKRASSVRFGRIPPFLLKRAMGLLDQLWDDTLAGPRPETGLGKLRKHSTFNFRSSSGKETDGGNVRSDGDQSPLDAPRVTRSIMIVKPPGYQSGSPPVSPAGSTPPVSPFSGGGRESFRFRRRSTSDAYEKRNEVGLRSSTTPYDM